MKNGKDDMARMSEDFNLNLDISLQPRIEVHQREPDHGSAARSRSVRVLQRNCSEASIMRMDERGDYWSNTKPDSLLGMRKTSQRTPISDFYENEVRLLLSFLCSNIDVSLKLSQSFCIRSMREEYTLYYFHRRLIQRLT